MGNEGDQESQVLPIGVDSLITGPPILLAEVKLASSKILPSRYSCPSCESCEIFVKKIKIKTNFYLFTRLSNGMKFYKLNLVYRNSFYSVI